jgi:hypothetical protein
MVSPDTDMYKNTLIG